jgi:hypothetical protein
VIGTAFFIQVPSEAVPERVYLYLVTAHQVLEDQNKVEMEVPHPGLDGLLSSPVTVKNWTQPLKQVDLAVAPLAHSISLMGIRLDTQVLPDRPRLLFPGSTVYYVGVLVPIDRTMARSGTIGALSQTGLDLSGYNYPAHLVDCRSYEGFSGSPCFGEVPLAGLSPVEPPYPMPDGMGPVGDMHYLGLLCGMFTAHLKRDGDGDAVSRFGVGVMLRSEEIRKALMTDELRKERADQDEAAGEADDQPRFKHTGAAGGATEFENFEELTRRLVNTPKSEVDEKRRAEKDAS